MLLLLGKKLPEYKLEERIYILSDKLKDVIDIKSTDNEIEWKCKNLESSIILKKI